MTVDELIEKLKEFDGTLTVESIEFAGSVGSCSCCSEMEYDYAEICDPYLAKGTIWREVRDGRSKTGVRRVCQTGDVVRIDARGC